MAGPYPNYPNYGMYTSYYNAGQNGRPLIQPNSYYGRNLHFQQPLLDPLSTHFPEFDDQNHAILSAQGSTRTRKRLGPGGDHVKFRRTRSGCFTCRNRRVKVWLTPLLTVQLILLMCNSQCDEAHPVCERMFPPTVLTQAQLMFFARLSKGWPRMCLSRASFVYEEAWQHQVKIAP